MFNTNYYEGYSALFKVTISTHGKVFAISGTKRVLPELAEEVCIGVDQSTTQTGICITDLKGKPIAVLDLINLGLPANIYIEMTREWVFNNFSVLKINRIVYEEVGHNAPQRYVKKKLQAVANIFEAYKVASREDFTVAEINNVTWKKHYLADPCYKGRKKARADVKQAIVEETCKRFPQFERYQYYNYGHDSCDATGIIVGYFEECFIDNDIGKMQVNTTMPSMPKRKFSISYHDITLEDTVANFGPAVKVLRYNPNFTLDDNVKRAGNYAPNGVILVPDSEKTLMLWRFNSGKELSLTAIMFVQYCGS
jgi:hypothetical protein